MGPAPCGIVGTNDGPLFVSALVVLQRPHAKRQCAAASAHVCEQLIQLRELFGQTFGRTGEGFVEGRFCGVKFV